MQENKKKSELQSPAEIAREAFKRLALERIAPTPDAYRKIYDEIAGNPADPGPGQMLADIAADIAAQSPDAAVLAAELQQALQAQDWDAYGAILARLLEQRRAPAEAVRPPAVPDNRTPERKSSIPLVEPLPTEAPRTAGIPLVDEPPPAKSRLADIALVEDDPTLRLKPKAGPAAPSFGETAQLRILRDLLMRTLSLAVGSLLHHSPPLLQEAERLAAIVKDARTEAALNDVSARLKQLCFRIELRAADAAEEHELLLRLFNLLLENVGELLEDDSWLSGQIAAVQDLLAGPINHNALHDATRSLKEVIYKQGVLKHSLTEAKATVKNMMMTFIDQLGVVAANTGDYHKKIDNYSRKISQAKGIPELNTILDDLMRDTKTAQVETLRSRDDMIAARQAVQEAEARVQDLESKLLQLSELVREDQLTGSLNRRGLDDVFEREAARSERRGTALCVALLDLDDFKRLNDTYGHGAGDEVLIHLVRVIKETLRTMDVIARFGGEEFVVVLPDTEIEEARQIVVRLQRELTKRIFMYGNHKLLITFSAGVALHGPGEDQSALLKRADEALYRAKREGKNRVVIAD